MANITHLQVPGNAQSRSSTVEAALPSNGSSFVLGTAHKTYKHQFANIYFVRLRLLREAVERRAKARWRGLSGSPPLVPRVLEVVKSQLCIILGTVYMDMPLKPNVLEDLGRDRFLPAPPSREKYHSPDDAIMLEDESGRVQLVGDILRRAIDAVNEGDAQASPRGTGNLLVTGVIMACLGRETASGEFEVKDVCFAGMAPMMFKGIDETVEGMDVDGAEPQDNWIALISGLETDETSTSDIRTHMLAEYLSGEAGGIDDQLSAAKISRLIVAGNSLAPIITVIEKTGPLQEIGAKSKRFGQETSQFSSAPTEALGAFLTDVAQAMPVHLLAGATDPSGVLLPQQPLPRAMLGNVKSYDSFCCETNPVWLGFETSTSASPDPSFSTRGQRSLFVHSGQSLEDMYKYVPSPPTTRLDLACAAMQWRHIAPTAPDTLWCYPYFTADPFVLQSTPDIYVVGCQPEFATRVVSSTDDEGDDPVGEERRCRVILVPGFKKTGTLVLVNLRNLEVKTVEFGLKGLEHGHTDIGQET